MTPPPSASLDRRSRPRRPGAAGRAGLEGPGAHLRPQTLGSTVVALAALGALASCGGDAPTDVRLELPLGPAHRAVVVAVGADDEAVTLVAADIVAGGIPPVMQPILPDRGLTVTALLYDAPLAEYALPAGPVTLADRASAARPLPAPAEIQQARVDAGRSSSWSPVGALPAALAELRLPAPDPCPSFEATALSLGEVSAPRSVLGLDDTWALVTTAGPEVFFLDGARVVRQATPVALSSGYRRADGEVWLGGEGGEVFRGAFTADPEPQLTLTAEGSVGSRERIVDLVGAPDGPVEHFALTSDDGVDERWGAFEWFDGAQWRTPGLRRNTPHDATWVAPGYGLFASFFRDGLLYGAKDGEETSIEVTSVVLGSVAVIERVPGLGLVAATTAGEVHRELEPGQWARVAGTTTERIGDVAGYGGGLVFLHGTTLGFVPTEGGACREASLFAPERTSVNRLAVVGHAVAVPLVAVEGADLREQQVAWFTRSL